MIKPYQEQVLEENTFIREFSQDIDGLDLIWHMDDEDRTIVAIEETDWLFQFDDELPLSLNSSIFIPRHKIHRIIKGNRNLKIRVVKHAD